MREKHVEANLYKNAPSYCTKPGCRGSVFIHHDDGWQCFNCMKIVYRDNQKANNNKASLRCDHS